MKNFKRILAMALAATLLLSFLTACGQTEHTVSNELGEAWIEARLDALNSVRSETAPTLKNDPALKALCDDALAQLKDGTTRYPIGGILYKVLPAENGYKTGITIAYDASTIDENNTCELTPLTVEDLENPYRAEDRDFYDRQQAIGLSYRVFSDGSVYTVVAWTAPSSDF